MNRVDQLCVITDEIGQDFEHVLDVVSEFGVKTVDLRKIWNKNIADFTDAELKRLKDALDKKGMHVAVITGPFGKCFLPGARLSNTSKQSYMRNYEYNLKSFDRLVEISDYFDTNLLRIFTFLRMGIDSEEKAWQMMKEFLDPHIKKAEELGKTLLVENDLGMNVGTIKQTKRFFQEYPSENVKLILDPGNFYMERDRTDPEAYEYFYDNNLVGHIHVKDPKRKIPFLGALFTAVGEGKIDYEALFKQAFKHDYRGYIALETHSLTKKEEKSKKSLNYLVDLLKRFD